MLEWLVLEQRFHRNLTILDKTGHFVSLISLSHVGHMYAATGVSSLLQRDIWHCGDGIGFSDKYILWVNAMRCGGAHAVVIVVKLYCYIYWLLGEGHQKHVLE